MCLDMDEGSTVNDVFEKMFKNPGKIMNLVKNVGNKLDNKIKEGDIKESELIEEASEMMSKMKDIPGMKDINGMLEKMGMGGLGGKGGKVNMNAFKSHMNSNMKQAKRKERMQEKLQKRQQMRGVQGGSQQQSSEPKDVSAEDIKQLLDNDWLHTGITKNNTSNNLVFSVGDKAEKTPARSNNKKKNKKKKKKNKN